MSRAASFVSVGVLALVSLVCSSADAQPKKKKPAPAAAGASAAEESSVDFDRLAASKTINDVDLQKCRVTNAQRGDGHVMITFGNDGAAQSVQIDKGPWMKTPVAKCMAKEFRKTKVPAFRGEAVTVGKTFHFE